MFSFAMQVLLFNLDDLERVYHRKVAWGTEDFTQGPAMTHEQAKLDSGRY